MRAWAGLEALEQWKRDAVARRLLARGAPAAGDAEIHPRRTALRPGRRAPPPQHGGGRRHAQQPLDHAAGAHGAGLHPSESCGWQSGGGGCAGEECES